MSPVEAAEVIGCSASHVRNLIRAGKLKASSIQFRGMVCYNISEAEAKRFRDQPVSGVGFPRGRQRNTKFKLRKW